MPDTAFRPPLFLLYIDDYDRSTLYDVLGPHVTTSDWRACVGYLRAHPGLPLVCELSSARALDTIRAVLADSELSRFPVIAVACDPETTEAARRAGAPVIVPEGDTAAIRPHLGKESTT